MHKWVGCTVESRGMDIGLLPRNRLPVMGYGRCGYCGAAVVGHRRAFVLQFAVFALRNGGAAMERINLRKYYAWYQEDCWVEVTDEVQQLLQQMERRSRRLISGFVITKPGIRWNCAGSRLAQRDGRIHGYSDSRRISCAVV